MLPATSVRLLEVVVDQEVDPSAQRPDQWPDHQEQGGQNNTALDLINRGLSISPTNLNLLDTKGTILLKMSDRASDARTVFERLVALSPADSGRKAKALLQLSRACVKLKDLAQASQYSKRAMDIDQKINVFTPEEQAEIESLISSGN